MKKQITLSVSLAFALLLFTLSVYSQDTIHLKKYAGNLKKVSVTILDKNYDFIFDTGGGETYISPQLIEKMGKQAYGSTAGIRMNGEVIITKRADSVRLKIGQFTFMHQVISVWDIMNILPKDFPELHGVISLKTFKNNIIELRLSDNIIVVHTKETAVAAKNKAQKLNAIFSNGLYGNEVNMHIMLNLGNKKYAFLFDSGNLNPIIVSDTLAVELGYTMEQSKNNAASLQFTLGNKKMNEPVVFKKVIYDGALNYNVISRYNFIIDFKKQELYFY